MFCANNPINLIDPDGRSATKPDWVDAKGNLIYDPAANDGKGDYTKYATNNDRTLGDGLRETKTGQAQFDKLVAPGQKTQIEINQSDVITDKEGQIKVGNTQNTADISFGSGPKEADVTASTITVYFAGIDKADASGKQIFGSENKKGLSFSEFVSAILGHEIEHTTDENQTINLNKGEDASESDAYKVSDKIIKEYKELK